MNQVKTIFNLTKHELMFMTIGAIIMIGFIVKVLPHWNKVMKMRKEFYEKINGRFDEIKLGIGKIERCMNASLELQIEDMVDKYRTKGEKDHFADSKFTHLLHKYEDVGDGNSESLKKQWESIPFEIN